MSFSLVFNLCSIIPGSVQPLARSVCLHGYDGATNNGGNGIGGRGECWTVVRRVGMTTWPVKESVAAKTSTLCQERLLD